eukprot:TRINITY_DN13311_c0_g1::TRINITY_DN13311_c0_g1_i1::g.12666::m.12666 TRINITY_DN13311_c0_g1::TRINITY_DN13311_c0_g1_i1::g.12666  ORF type:complete len:290 (+),score=51.61,sp/Q9LNH6/NPS12_ARATH/27.56/1e-18,V-SNARE_C/PF12352.3/5.7e+03,V-SNARE_C/PF12352.3/3.5e-07,Sec20/PF03908.8/9.1e+02,Sec20/PF03908.8/8.6e-07,V-SNARE/PF05008.10/1.5e-05,V-SNARE/PF05008.10/5.8,SNARE/PF05739.14/1.1e+03,SNARE/PF05739.14/0.00015,RVT_thumb/PF06817.9/0.021,Tropomyosin/PF00261.15/54,Tropomyosin/PF00261.15/0.012,T4SS/PF07996.6/
MSEEIQYYDEELQDLCDEITKGIEKLGSLSKDAKQEKINFLNGRIARARQVFHSYKVELRELSKADLAIYEAKSKTHNNNIQKLISDLNWTKTANEKAELFEGKEVQDPQNLSAKQMIDYGKKIQDESLDSLARSKKLVAESQQVGTDTAAKLKEQTEQLKQIHSDVERIESNLKQADKLIRRFMRRMMTDKLVLCMLFLIVCGIGGIIAYHIVDAKDGKEQVKEWLGGNDNDGNTDTNTTDTSAVPMRGLVDRFFTSSSSLIDDTKLRRMLVFGNSVVLDDEGQEQSE